MYGDETVRIHASAEGLEMDIVSHDVKKFFGLLLKKNGYVLEQLYSPLIVQTTPEHAELKTTARMFTSRGIIPITIACAARTSKLFPSRNHRAGSSPSSTSIACCSPAFTSCAPVKSRQTLSL